MRWRGRGAIPGRPGAQNAPAGFLAVTPFVTRRAKCLNFMAANQRIRIGDIELSYRITGRGKPVILMQVAVARLEASPGEDR